jgi:hypothetical protein
MARTSPSRPWQRQLIGAINGARWSRLGGPLVALPLAIVER